MFWKKDVSTKVSLFIEDLERVVDKKYPVVPRYCFVGGRAIGKSLLARRIKELFPRCVEVWDELEPGKPCPTLKKVVIATSNVPVEGFVCLESQLKGAETCKDVLKVCPILDCKTKTIEDIKEQIKKLKFV